MAPRALVALSLFLGLVPLAAAQAPALPAGLPEPGLPEAPAEAGALLCQVRDAAPAGQEVLDLLAACGGADARAGAAPEAKAEAAPVAEAEEAEEAAEELAGLAEGFAAETVADPAGTPERLPGFLDAVVAWVTEALGTVPRALEGAAGEVGGALRGAGDALAVAGLGLDQAAHGAADAFVGAAGSAAAAFQDAGDAFADAVAQLFQARGGAGGSAGGVKVPKGVRDAAGPAEGALAPVLDLLG